MTTCYVQTPLEARIYPSSSAYSPSRQKRRTQLALALFYNAYHYGHSSRVRTSHLYEYIPLPWTIVTRTTLMLIVAGASGSRIPYCVSIRADHFVSEKPGSDPLPLPLPLRRDPHSQPFSPFSSIDVRDRVRVRRMNPAGSRLDWRRHPFWRSRSRFHSRYSAKVPQSQLVVRPGPRRWKSSRHR
jgi:hypothetical protein